MTVPSVTKIWDDDGDRDGLRPDHLNVTFSDGKTSEVITLNANNSWTAILSENDEPINYTWTEESVNNYTSDNVCYNGTCAQFTNRHVPETVDVSLTINWNDGNNSDGSRPASVTATLLGGDVSKSVAINGDSTAASWTKTVTVPKNYQGSPIEYSWTKPSTPEGYKDK